MTYYVILDDSIPSVLFCNTRNNKTTIPYAACMVYLPTFGWFLGQMLVNIPFMEHMGKTTILASAKRRELSGMIHWITINNNPSNTQQAVHSLRLAPVSITRVCLKVPESLWSKNVWRNCGEFLVPFSGHTVTVSVQMKGYNYICFQGCSGLLR